MHEVSEYRVWPAVGTPDVGAVIKPSQVRSMARESEFLR